MGCVCLLVSWFGAWGVWMDAWVEGSGVNGRLGLGCRIVATGHPGLTVGGAWCCLMAAQIAASSPTMTEQLTWFEQGTQQLGLVKLI